MNSRNKGKIGELELAKLLRDHGFKSRRGQQYCGTSGEADVTGLPGLHIECKRVEKLNLEAAMEQAVRDARSSERPAVFHRKNRREKGGGVLLFDEIYTLSEKDAQSQFDIEAGRFL